MFPTNLTLEGLLTCMEVLVFYGMSTNSKPLMANLAFVLRGTFMCSDMHLDLVLGCVPEAYAKMTFVFAVFVVIFGMESKVHVIVETLVAVVTLDRLVEF